MGAGKIVRGIMKFLGKDEALRYTPRILEESDEFSESNVNRGKTGPGTNSGSFAPKGGGAGRSKADTPERKESVRQAKGLAKDMEKFHVAKFLADRERMIKNLPDEVDFKMPYNESLKWLDEHLPKDSDLIKASYEDKFDYLIDPKELLHGDDHLAMFACAYQNSKLTSDEVIKCIEDKEFCREKVKESMQQLTDKSDEEINKVESSYDTLPDRIVEYKDSLDSIRQQDREIKEKFGNDTTPSETYFKAVETGQKDLSFEQYATQRAYIDGGYGINAERLNKMLYSGRQLTENEKKFVDILRNSATELQEDVVLYRMVNDEALLNIFGTDIPEVGQEYKQDGFGSSCCGAVSSQWAGYPVCMRIRAKKGQKAIALDNKMEGEILLLNGLKGKVQSVKVSDEDLPVWGFGSMGSMKEVGYEDQHRMIIDIEVTDDGSNLQS